MPACNPPLVVPLVLAGNLALAALASGCEASGPDTLAYPSGTSDPWFEVGWGETRFSELRDGDELWVVWGSQGAAMFPLPIHAGGFPLAADPRDYSDERTPLLDLELDIEGFNDGVGGHFRRIANYPLVFDVRNDGTYAFHYVALILPDELDPAVLDGRDARLWVRLRPYALDPLEHELDLVVRAD